MKIDIFYTDQEVAEILKVSARTVADQRRAGRLPFRKIGRTPRISEADLTRYVNEVRKCQETVPPKTNTESDTSKTPKETAKATACTYSGQNVVDLDVAARARAAAQKHRLS